MAALIGLASVGQASINRTRSGSNSEASYAVGVAEDDAGTILGTSLDGVSRNSLSSLLVALTCRLSTEPKVTGSNPVGCTRLTTIRKSIGTVFSTVFCRA